MDPITPLSERQRVRTLIQRYGRNATAFQTLEPGFRYFFHGETCVAYVETGGAWVAAGAPIGEPAQLRATAAAFVRTAERAGRRCCFLAAEERLKEQWDCGLENLHIGAQPIYDPQQWTSSLKTSRNLREQLRRARAKGVRVRKVSPEQLQSEPLRTHIHQLIERWLGTRDLAPMGFLLRIEPFLFPNDRGCFVAEQDGKLLGFAGLIPVPLRGGWFVEDLVRDPSAPNGTSELLIDGVMRWAAESGCHWVTLGVAPLAGEVPSALRWMRRASAFLYDFRGLQQYKTKFLPRAWSSSYLLYPGNQSALRSLIDALSAFTRGGVVQFGLLSWLRGSGAVLRFFAALLIPWTLLLMAVPTHQFFVNPWVKWGWVGFDILLTLGLFRLLRRSTQTLVTVLASAVTLDAILTLTQAWLWNWHTAIGGFQHLMILIACAAPLTASLSLWGARQRLQIIS